MLVGRPGRWRDSLRALITALPELRLVGIADDGPTALRMLVTHRPLLVVLDCDVLSADAPWLITRIKLARAHCLALASDSRQRQLARATRADGVLLKGFTSVELFQSIARFKGDVAVSI